MRPAKVQPDDYIDFLIATPRAYSATEAARVQPDRPDPPAHDAFTRLLTRLEPDPDTLWAEARPQVDRTGGVLVVAAIGVGQEPIDNGGNGRGRGQVRRRERLTDQESGVLFEGGLRWPVPRTPSDRTRPRMRPYQQSFWTR